MKLYRTTDGRWVGTQADAGKGFTQVEVPTDKPGLLSWLNENWSGVGSPEPVGTTEPDLLHEAELRALDAAAPPPARSSVIPVFDLTGVEEFVQECTPAQLGRIADNVCWRLKELVGGLREAK